MQFPCVQGIGRYTTITPSKIILSNNYKRAIKKQSPHRVQATSVNPVQRSEIGATTTHMSNLQEISGVHSRNNVGWAISSRLHYVGALWLPSRPPAQETRSPHSYFLATEQLQSEHCKLQAIRVLRILVHNTFMHEHILIYSSICSSIIHSSIVCTTLRM